MLDELALIVSMVANLALSLKVWLPAERLITSAPEPPIRVSLFPSPADVITIMSFPSLPVMESV